MQKYKFQFESVKRVKEILEKKAQKEVAEIEREIENLKAEYARLEEEKKNFFNSGQSSFKASELQFRNDYRDLMDKKLEALQQHIEEMYIKRDEKMEDLIQKSKEHKIFDTLDDNQKERHILEQNKIESGDIDEIAIGKFIRKSK
jgi:flagellar export protein FliJ